MPDNVAITAGLGTSIATDQIGSDHYQRVKVTWGVDGTAVDASATNPLPTVLIGTMSLSGEDHVGEFGRSATIMKIIPTLTSFATPYSSGDTLGGKITLTNAMRVVSGTGVLRSVTLHDLSNVKAALTILLFDADFTCPADNAAWAWTSTDRPKLLAAVVIQASDWVTLASEAVASVPAGDIVLAANGTANLYGVIVAGQAVTYTNIAALKVHFGIEQN